MKKVIKMKGNTESSVACKIVMEKVIPKNNFFTYFLLKI